VQFVFHLASVPGGLAERDYALGHRVNLQATQELFWQLRAQGLLTAMSAARSRSDACNPMSRNAIGAPLFRARSYRGGRVAGAEPAGRALDPLDGRRCSGGIEADRVRQHFGVDFGMPIEIARVHHGACEDACPAAAQPDSHPLRLAGPLGRGQHQRQAGAQQVDLALEMLQRAGTEDHP
jgi:hypothetical protein